ncbi:tetratricopeptide repeat protein [Kangiella sp. TOML190]|uniref:tetratricopeptide repeat protein n=1 Tax=Kangiella sp. TOML190 TaxID=2931351 RepID=UPI00203BA139|nr:hypothetical protein [Kangiella sp. TOML190]
MIRKLAIFTALASILSVSTTADALVSTKYTGSCQFLAKETGKYPEKKVKGFKSEATFKKMQNANQLMADGNKAQAKAILMEIKNSSSDSFTLSIVNQYLARLAYDAGNFNQAVQYARQVVELDALPVNAILSMKKQVAYAYVAKKDYKNAINWLKQYFDQVIKPPVSDYKMLAQLYYQDKQYKSAICPSYIALKKTSKAKDKEPLYKMLFGMHYRLKDLAGSAKILAEMINFYPNNKQYWEQLYSIEHQRGDTKAALAVSELAYQKGLWTTEKEIKNLASMHANNGSPYNAAARIEEGIKKGIVKSNVENLKLLARFLDQAKADDKAISAYRRLINTTGSGKYAFRIGNIHFSKEKYKEAISAFNEAVQKGGLSSSEAGNTYLQLGAAKFYLGQEAGAIQALNKAKNYEQTRKSATSWVGFIQEKQRIRELMKKDAAELEAEVAAETEKAEETE